MKKDNFMNDIAPIFITTLSVFIVFKNLLIFGYNRIIKNTKIKDKRHDYLITRLFGKYDKFMYFWLSVLWLCVFFFDDIITLSHFVFQYIRTSPLII